ncbi:hypothetical protein C2I18_15710 [Paenibacillus sp. PK3_47]|uniref:DUF4304 domain-containing protein n=1 Tax=Paenibacillus sp. PK3_47 TaxID=2072642 RepID=UPI00201E1917|nr:DUF4304 domain-containing protein [Paenibacillus sp. PK3_47]UQZ34848.1 hypothetical protein C2I18_15710 [Paenibacillus sp. PK3_47]
MQDLFNQIIKNDIKPFFTGHGYSKKDLNFYKTQGNFINKFNLQKLKANTWDHVMFYINCSIHSTELAQFQSALPTAAPLENKAHFTVRIEQIVPSAPDHYSLTPDTDPDKITAELLLHLEEALTVMQTMNSARAIVDYYMKRTALHLSEETFRYLLHSGDKETAQYYLGQLYSKYGAERRWSIFEKKYGDIFAEYGMEV